MTDSTRATADAPKRPSPGRRRAARLLLVLLVASQPIQYVVDRQWGEPYPALFMPRFEGTVTDATGALSLDLAEASVAFADGTTAPMALEVLTEPAPVAFRDAIVGYMFAAREATEPVASGSPSALGGLKRRIVPGWVAKYDAKRATQADPRTIEWLRRRLAEHYPGRQPVSVTITWYRHTYRGGITPADRSRERIGAYEMEVARVP